jgi:Spy/CpxP family protein refolding chaperone
MRSRIIAGLAVVALTVAGAAVGGSVLEAQRGPGRGGRGFAGGPGGFGRAPGLEMLRQLDLTDQQRQQVRGIFEQHKADFQQVRQRIHTAVEAQRAAAEAAPPDDATIRAKATEVGTAEGDMAVLASHVRAEVFQVLTPEQQAKAATLKQQRQQKREARREKMQQFRQQHQQQQPPAAPPQL